MSQSESRLDSIGSTSLVNNAGIEPYFALNEMDGAQRSPPTDFRDPLMQSRLGGTYVCTKHVLPIMKQQHSGHIINVYGALARQRHGRLRCISVAGRAPMLHKLRREPSARCERLRGRAGPGELSDRRG
jgi:NAD(P)-dependent dehydrogenase (short-subunit alcohol dehydrogenase family)